EALRIDRLAGDGILREEPPVALEVDARARALRLILRELSLGLVERRLERAGVDLREQIAALHQLPLAEGHFEERSVDPAVDGRGVERGHGAERIDRDVHGAGGRGAAPHGLRRLLRLTLPPWRNCTARRKRSRRAQKNGGTGVGIALYPAGKEMQRILSLRPA